MSIELRNLHKQFKQFTALDRINLDIQPGELVALLGPSGCGKTTLLRMIAGLDQPDSGSILFNGADATNQTVKNRQVGFVFQHYALFRHMTVFENVAFGLRVRPAATRPSKEAIRQKVHELLQLVQLDWLADRYPAQLSGGQRQRIALARALAVEPQFLLLDEPFGALDTKVRKELRRWLRRLHDEMHVTSIFVTHDQEEALEVADRIVVMNKGKIEQIGSPAQIYDTPATPFVYQFIGNVNMFHSRVHGGIAEIGPLRNDSPEHADAEDAKAIAYVRPHDIHISTQWVPEAISAEILDIRPIGAIVRLELHSAQHGIIEVELTRERYQTQQFILGHTVYITTKRIKVFLENTEAVEKELIHQTF